MAHDAVELPEPRAQQSKLHLFSCAGCCAHSGWLHGLCCSDIQVCVWLSSWRHPLVSYPPPPCCQLMSNFLTFWCICTALLKSLWKALFSLHIFVSKWYFWVLILPVVFASGAQVTMAGSQVIHIWLMALCWMGRQLLSLKGYKEDTLLQSNSINIHPKCIDNNKMT